MKKNLFFLIIAFLASASLWAQTASINLNSEKQVIKGFGGINHTIWYSDLNASERNLCFGNGEGQLGLSVLRIYVSENRSDWARVLPTAQRAAELGVTIFASPWNPPASMTYMDGNQKRINTNSFAAYAQHLNDFVTYMRDNGVELYAISTQNEPDYAHDWTEWTPQESVNFIKGYADQIDCRLMTPESFQYRKNIYDPILNDADALSKVDIFGTHLYGTRYADFPYPLYQEKGAPAGKELWMTEVYTESKYDANIWDNGAISQDYHALKVAEHIHYAMTDGQFQTYVFWPLRRYYALIHDGANASTPYNGVSPASPGTITKRGYCMGQFSKFIRPGFVRVEATKSPANNVFVSAYKKDGEIVIVAVNKNTSSRNLTLNIPGIDATTFEQYTTSGSKNMSKGSNINGGSSFQVTLDAASVTTFVGSTEPVEQGNIVFRAAGTAGDENVQLIVDGQVLTSWTLSSGFNTYSYEGPSNGVFRLNYTNDADGRDVQIDYLEVDGTRYEAEDQQINTGSYANDQCGGGEYTEMMYCSGYIEFNLVDPTVDSDNDGTPDVDDECPNDPNKIAAGDCGCGNPEGDCPVDDYRTNIHWTVSGGNQGLAACKAKYLGNIAPSSWGAAPIIRDDWGDYWNQLSQENAGKWGVVEGNRDQYNWGDLDVMYNYCMENDIPFKHHVFIWGSQQPEWLAALSPQEQLEEVEEWYSLFKQRYPETAIIDVVNESLPGHAPDVAARDAMGGFNNGASVPYLANHPYLAKYGYGTGWDYIIYAFAKARDYFPDAILLLNDYNIINNTNNLNAHLEIVNILKERNLIDGVGIQAHAFSVDNLSANALQTNLDRLASAGLPIHVTELDIRGDDGNEQQQRDRYARTLPIFYEHPAVAGVTLWGYVEGQNWFDYTGLINEDGSERAAMTWLKQYMSEQPCASTDPEVTLLSPSKDTSVVVGSAVYISAEVSDPEAINTLQFFVDGTQVGETEYLAPYFTTVTFSQTGTYEVTAVINLPDGNSVTSDPIIVTVNVPQAPYDGTNNVPGIIEAEHYDVGGNGFGYSDTDNTNQNDVDFRSGDGVDIEETDDTGGGYNVGYVRQGEWLAYTVEVVADGTYDLDLRMAADGDGKTFHIEIDGEDVSGPVAVPNTGGWQTWETVTVEGLDLTSGEHEVKIVFDSDYMNFNWMEFRSQVVTGYAGAIDNTLSVYPNPFTENGFRIEGENLKSYTLIDVSGKVIESGKTSENNLGTNLNNGVYFLKIETEGSIKVYKISKE